MAYSTYADVRAICDTDITNAEITSLIAECDDLLDLMVTMSSVTANVRRALSRTYTAIRCFLKDPDAMGLGEFNYEREYALEKLNKEFDRMVRVADGGISTRYKYEPRPSVL